MIKVLGVMAFTSLLQLISQSQSSPPVRHSGPDPELQVIEIMNRVLARDYRLVDGYDANNKLITGVKAISWVPPTQQDNTDIARLGESAVPALASYFNDFNGKQGGFEQLLAVHFLGVIGTPSILEPLGRALNVNDWQVARLSALSVLGRLSDPEATVLIRSMLNDGDPQVSTRAKNILAAREQRK